VGDETSEHFEALMRRGLVRMHECDEYQHFRLTPRGRALAHVLLAASGAP
jgi:Mn-dependent DtxR family transcriptional regulator